MAEEPKMLTLKKLQERGWTGALVKQFLKEPAATKPNPHYRSASPMRLYAPSRVEEIERPEDWMQAKARATRRSLVGKAVAARTAAVLVESASHMRCTVRRLPAEQVLTLAIASYNTSHWEIAARRFEPFEEASHESDPDFLERSTVNSIRHHLTSYDSHLEEVAGQIGVRQAGQVIRRRIYAEIAKAYPEYAAECKRQMQTRADALPEGEQEA